MDYEQLGVFYLGKKFDLDKNRCTDELVLYESRDLVTHAVCVGMTGSGKTGLCIDLLEEAAIDNIPVIAIDPKGDLSNLLLTFPKMDAESFKDWVDPDEARRQNISLDELAESEAQKWSTGISDWHQDAQRVKKLKSSAEFAVYTPASNAGIPLSIVQSFACPGDEILDERDLLREQISSTATSILSLLGIESDPLKSREHILLSSILDNTWKQGANLDLHSLIAKVQNPPIKQVGAIPLESFFPAKERYELAMTINNLLASPGFEAWLDGEALDIDKLLYTSDGKNRVSVISIAHLPDAERMFFVSLLLTQLLSWMRRQSGTSSLRAVFYMDEVHGYFPPVANPPSKAPLISLLKQARAFGLGMVLATQNPVDLDYKALGNTGTWFIGRLQTERDKMRVLDGLEGAATNSGAGFNRGQIDKLISGLSKQVFLVNNIHDNECFLMKTRFALSYLRGPLSRAQLKTLKKSLSSSGEQAHGSKQSAEAGTANLTGTLHDYSASMKSQSGQLASAALREDTANSDKKQNRPLLPPEISEAFVPFGKARESLADGAKLVYKPMLFAALQIRFSDTKTGLDVLQNLNLLTLIKSEVPPVKWEKSFGTKFGAETLMKEPVSGIEFSALPSEGAEQKNYKLWASDLINWIIANKKLEVFRCPISGQVSNPDESEKDFRLRLGLASREKRDGLLSALSKKYGDKLAAVHDKFELAEMNLSNQEAQARSIEMEAAVNVGASIFGALVGRKVMSQSNIRNASSAVRKAGQVQRQKFQVNKAQETRDILAEKVAAIQSEFESEMNALKTKLDPETQELVKVSVALKKSNVDLNKLCLAWAPCIRQSDGRITVGW